MGGTRLAGTRPARVYVVGVAWILIGLLHLQVVLGLLLPVWLTAPKPDSFGITMLVIGVAVGVVTAVVATVSSVGLFGLKRWGRLALELLTWVYCALSLALSVFGMYMFITWPDPSERWIPAITMIAYPFVLATMVALLWALRSKQMRQAFAPTA